MKVLVTGGSGFLGSHIADALSKAGHDVRVFDVLPSPYLRPDQTMVVGDVLDAGALNAAAEGCDFLYHLAAVADIDAALGNPRATIVVNIMGTLNALEAARSNGVSHFVLASSIYVYSNQGSFYRTSKQASELLVHDYQERFGLNYTILRFGSLYGPRADNTNAVYRMLLQAIGGGCIQYGGTGQEVREYIHVFDAAQASVEVMEPGYINEIIHLTGRERMTTLEMMEMIKEMLGGKVEIQTNQNLLAGHYTRTPYSYTPKLGKKLVLHTYIDLGLGLLDCLEAIDQERQLDPHSPRTGAKAF